jgi:hypothetical protein
MLVLWYAPTAHYIIEGKFEQKMELKLLLAFNVPPSWKLFFVISKWGDGVPESDVYKHVVMYTLYHN